MRAGSYATVQGVDHPCRPLGAHRVRLFAPRTAARPPGFDDPGGFRWTRDVDSRDVTRTYVVLTRARWRERDVQVQRVMGDDALIVFADRSVGGDHRPDLHYDGGHWMGYVPVNALTAVEEITLATDLPDVEADVRAGGYATLDGVDYAATQAGTSRVRLSAPRSGPQPPGFKDWRGWAWVRVVDGHELTRRYYVRTVAVWRGRHVGVERVLGDRAGIEFYVTDFSVSYRPDLTLERHGRWSGSVPLDSLTDVEEYLVESVP